MFAQLPTAVSPKGTGRFDSGIVVNSDWLQANSLPLDRDALQSISGGVSLRRGTWSVDAGWLRIARDLSTVQGGTLLGGPLLHWRRVLFIPALGVFGGQAQASRDSTGYDWLSGGSQPGGHTPRYSYSSAATFGGGASLAIEVPVYRMLGIRAVAQQWYFSGTPLDGDRPRTVIGAGGSIRVWQ